MQVGLFVTCLVDLMRPSVGLATLKLLEHAECNVVFPPHQTCCGQPAFNSGDKETTKEFARKILREFKDMDYIVMPSGSCASMFKKHYLELFAYDEPEYQDLVALSMKSFELTDFLTNVVELTSLPTSKDNNQTVPKTVTYHDSCSGLRELGIKNQPRDLMKLNECIQCIEMDKKESETCCGFGGAFSVKYADISTQIAEHKCSCIKATEAQAIVGGDVGCLLNIEGTLNKEKSNKTEVWHIAELLAGSKSVKTL